MKKGKDEKIAILLKDLDSLRNYIKDVFVFSPLPIAFVSPTGVILEVNPAFERISHFSAQTIVGESVETIFEKQAIRALERDTLSKGAVSQREIKLFTKEGKAKICQVFTKLREDENKQALGFFLNVLDVTEVKKREKELHNMQSALLNILEDTEESRKRIEEEKNKTQAIIANFTDGLLVFDERKYLTIINPKAEALLNVQGKELVNNPISSLNGGYIVSLVKLILEGGNIKKVFRKELQLGANFYLEVSTVALLREKEKIGTLVILHDISREKTVERMKTEFVSLAAHQLRTPLSAIKWTLRMVLDGDLGKITKDEREYLGKAYGANERMIGLINDLLNVARIEEGRYLYKLEVLDIKEFVGKIVKHYEDEFSRGKISLKVELPKGGPIPVKVDKEKIELAINNLIENALHYTPKGGKVIISLAGNGNMVEFSVKDNGIGIPKDQQPRIFQKFFRAPNAMRTQTEGSGLGLFITRNIVLAHKGKIWFQSEEGKGTTFHIALPIYEEKRS